MTPAELAGLARLSTPVLLTAADGRVAYANPASEDLLGLSQRELMRQPVWQLFQPASAVQKALETALADNAGVIEHVLALETVHAGQQHHISLLATPVDSHRVLLELHPLDQKLRQADEAHQLQQQHASREMIRNLAHEIKNPLGGIRGAAQLLAHELADRPALCEYTGIIQGEALRLQSLVDRLLIPHRRHAPGPVNVHELLERVRSIALAEYQHGLYIERDYDVSIPNLLADKEQLIQVVLNLLRNAIQSMQGQGQITLRTRIARQVTLARKRYPLVLKLDVIDNGPGVPEAIREHLFYPLVSGRPEGTGLGLTLSQAFIHQHGGNINFESSPGHTCFTVMLPYTPLLPQPDGSGPEGD